MRTDARTDWRTAAVSVPGAFHLRANAPCQDAHRVAHLPDGVLVGAVADGAGSAPLADIGSACAVRAAVDGAVERLTAGLPGDEGACQGLLRAVFQFARDALAAEAAARSCPLTDLATTLLLALATPELVAAGQVGDGAIVARLAGDQLQAVTRPLAQEYLNETVFLTSGDAFRQAQFAALRQPVTGLALFSDGLQMLALKMPEATPHAPFFAPLLRFVAEVTQRATAEEQLRRFLQSPRVTDRADDDLTLVLAVRAGA